MLSSNSREPIQYYCVKLEPGEQDMGGAPSAPQEEYYCPDLAGIWLSTRCSEWTNNNIGSHKTRARMPNTKMTYRTDGKGEGWVGDLYVFVAARPNGPGRYVAKGVIKLVWSASDGELTLSDGNNALQVRYPSNGIVEYWRREGSGAGGGQQQDQAALAQARARQEAEAEAAEARLREQQAAEARARREAEAAEALRREQQAAEARARQEVEAAEARRREHQAAEARARQEAEAAEARRREQQAAAACARQEAEAAAAAAEAKTPTSSPPPAASATTAGERGGGGRQPSFCFHFLVIILPRQQARDKHEENSKRETVSQVGDKRQLRRRASRCCRTPIGKTSCRSAAAQTFCEAAIPCAPHALASM